MQFGITPIKTKLDAVEQRSKEEYHAIAKNVECILKITIQLFTEIQRKCWCGQNVEEIKESFAMAMASLYEDEKKQIMPDHKWSEQLEVKYL